MKVSDSEVEGSALGWGGLRRAIRMRWHLTWALKLGEICTGHPFVSCGSLRWNTSLSPAAARPHSAAEHINLVWIAVLSDSGARVLPIRSRGQCSPCSALPATPILSSALSPPLVSICPPEPRGAGITHPVHTHHSCPPF